MSFGVWRLVHRTATAVIAVLAIAHLALTAMFYDSWSPDALWFLLAGLGLLLLAAMNWAHVGIEPCELPTAPMVRWANVAYIAAGFAALVVVPEPHAFVLLAALMIQGIAAQATLRSSHRSAEVDG